MKKEIYMHDFVKEIRSSGYGQRFSDEGLRTLYLIIEAETSDYSLNPRELFQTYEEHSSFEEFQECYDGFESIEELKSQTDVYYINEKSFIITHF